MEHDCQAHQGHGLFAGSQRVAAAVQKLQVSFLRLAEYQAAMLSRTTAAATSTADSGLMHFADTEDEALLGSAADTDAERRQQETVVKAAQLSANFAMELIREGPNFHRS